MSRRPDLRSLRNHPAGDISEILAVDADAAFHQQKRPGSLRMKSGASKKGR